MEEYTDQNRNDDFEYFISIYQDLYKKYGHKYIALRNKKILGVFDDRKEGIEKLSDKHKFGTYIIQECNGDESAYTASIYTSFIIRI